MRLWRHHVLRRGGNDFPKDGQPMAWRLRLVPERDERMDWWFACEEKVTSREMSYTPLKKNTLNLKIIPLLNRNFIFQIWVFPKIGVGPPNHPFVHRVWNHYFHHPFWDTHIVGNTHIYLGVPSVSFEGNCNSCQYDAEWRSTKWQAVRHIDGKNKRQSGLLPWKLTWFTWKSSLRSGKSSSKPSFWGSMLVFGGVSPFVL